MGRCSIADPTRASSRQRVEVRRVMRCVEVKGVVCSVRLSFVSIGLRDCLNQVLLMVEAYVPVGSKCAISSCYGVSSINTMVT